MTVLSAVQMLLCSKITAAWLYQVMISVSVFTTVLVSNIALLVVINTDIRFAKLQFIYPQSKFCFYTKLRYVRKKN